ncbi:MAG: PepSY-associated TM helix domain-containing protein [Mangrovibacterium sp.]
MAKKIIRKLHLWLGLPVGLIVFIVSTTGAIFCFQEEITNITQPWRFVEKQNLPFVPPSILIDSAQSCVPEAKPTGITYDGKTKAAGVGLKNDAGFSVAYLNPYDASIIQVKDSRNFDFFQFILSGHRSLWLPYQIGHIVVGVSVILFVILLISGLVLWYPKKWNKKTRNKSFKIKWNAKFKRLNYDLHNVFGFYTFIFALLFALTGLTISFNWFAKGVYYISSGGKEKPPYFVAQSDTANYTQLTDSTQSAIDVAFYKSLAQQPNPERIFLFPSVQSKEQAITLYFYQGQGTFYNRNSYYYDQYTLAPIKVPNAKFANASFADKLSLMNYDIHIGAIGGIWGKIIAFISSLIIASLPVTGFIIWRKKRH